MRLCGVEGCEARHLSKGYCQEHYDRYRRWGDPLAAAPDVWERYNAQVVAEGDCLLWTGYRTTRGYPIIGVGGKQTTVIRWRYAEDHDEVPKKLIQSCGNPLCVTIAHIVPKVIETCKNGHKFDTRNTRIRPDGSKACIACTSSALHQRRVRIRSSKQHVSVWQLHERDNGICQLCGGWVDPTLRMRHPLMASIDHVIPVSKGGDHTFSNTQLAHLRCNLSKGNRTKDVYVNH